ncbi:hypothetical protein E1212_06610 [Jiangella ureilytica]|uniref:Uncharacterized protein n=1 Tax=Jiangella ureilytica TaxID=2530374 RepID=A0A4V2XXG4_9ACTN|nr:hypothetical protein [Jiangella ureilytica]TDC53085.1 hypothetical protein E1212_06610 [Jiangella ureilytica]
MITVARVVATGTSIVTLVYLFLHDSWRADNVFLVPDLVLCAVLLVGAVLPPAWAGTVLLSGFALAAGVFGTSVSSYAVDGELGVPSLAGAVGCAAMTVLLGRDRSAGGSQDTQFGREDEVHAV